MFSVRKLTKSCKRQQLVATNDPWACKTGISNHGKLVFLWHCPKLIGQHSKVIAAGHLLPAALLLLLLHWEQSNFLLLGDVSQGLLWAIWSSPPPSPSSSLPPPPTLLPPPPTISWETFLRSTLSFLHSPLRRPSLSSLWLQVVLFSSGKREIFWFFVFILHHVMLEKTRLEGSHYLMFGWRLLLWRWWQRRKLETWVKIA